MTLYADSSALFKIYVVEPGSQEVQRLVSGATMVMTSAVTFVEIRAAFTCLRRERRLAPSRARQVKQQFEEDWHGSPRVISAGPRADGRRD